MLYESGRSIPRHRDRTRPMVNGWLKTPYKDRTGSPAQPIPPAGVPAKLRLRYSGYRDLNVSGKAWAVSIVIHRFHAMASACAVHVQAETPAASAMIAVAAEAEVCLLYTSPSPR